ncbi:phosphonoacetate hydrolase [Sneathiella chungangensis]|uniref:Phosphonoacetate hydrolase n=1 Tax=Sneathiella chungangensis TaxID=1418234 RepID=A0A845MA55_9PROT|nr:phosphonoacetate hydrolase [Sneathiella chungangensis]MZR21129.1 phosphonoacetate hydrolase [Sneathiella chungangensis]
MNKMSSTGVTVNERSYPFPGRTAVVICLDGCEPAYIDAAIDAGVMPTMKRIRETGTMHLAHCVIPSFTNPNNMSIATGQPPAVHGICGNFLLDPETGEEVMMNDPRFLRVPTIFKSFFDAGARIAIVTAKDKLRALLGHGLKFDDGRAVCFSTEKSDTTTVAEHGIDNASTSLDIPVPSVYSAELSEYVFNAGVKLMTSFNPDLMYLTTTDYVQHKAAPGTADANAFYEMFDSYLGQLDALGAAIIITADHGMKPKHKADGTPDVIYLQDLLDRECGEGNSRVILPITDPYVVHHGALGSFATAYLKPGVDQAAVIATLKSTKGIELVLDKAAAAKRFQLPADRIGDLVIISGENQVLGTSADRHDLSGLEVPLRSHGGLSEQVVPFILNVAMPDLPAAPTLRNFDAYYYVTRAAALQSAQ